MTKDLRERLEKARASPDGPDPVVRDLKERLEAVQCDLLPIRKQKDLLELLMELISTDSPEKIKELLNKARELLRDANWLHDLHVPRVDLVTNPANMRPFLVVKSEDPFDDPEPSVPEIVVDPVEKDLAAFDPDRLQIDFDPRELELSFDPSSLDLEEPAP